MSTVLPWRPVNVLVTGGAGYVGGQTVLHLRSLRWRVTALDDFSTGNRDPETHLIPSLIAATEDAPFVVCGDDWPTPDGTCIRDFVHIQDLAQAHELALRYLWAGGATAVVNLGSGRGASVREVLAAVERRLGRPVPAVVRARRPGDPPRLEAAIERAATLLGWRPELSDLDALIATAVRWQTTRPG